MAVYTWYTNINVQQGKKGGNNISKTAENKSICVYLSYRVVVILFIFSTV